MCYVWQNMLAGATKKIDEMFYITFLCKMCLYLDKTKEPSLPFLS